WMLAVGPVTRAPLRKPRLGLMDVARSVVDIPSRVGENLFWMGRYAERCEGLARLLRAALVRIADAAPQAKPELLSLVSAGERLKIFQARDTEGKREGEKAKPRDTASFIAAVVDPKLSGGVAANVLRLQASANQVRERMSTDNWH